MRKSSHFITFFLPTETYGGNRISEFYNIGSTICIDIPTHSNRRFFVITLRCRDVGRVPEENIPSPVPPSVVTWKHTSLDGQSAYFAINRNPRDIHDQYYMPPDEFTSAFPGLSEPYSGFAVSTRVRYEDSGFDFFLTNITKDLSDPDYLNFRSAFGSWECTLSNALGSQTETTFVSDSCKSTLVVIPQNSGILIMLYLQYIRIP